jgi:CubicO group peptidase (beta-lactamase class C family)
VTGLRAALDTAVARGERGVQVAAYQGGELLAEAWLGDRVDGDTLFPIFSVSKAVTSMAVHVQADRGLLSYERPVATYWPEFGQAGKADITVRDVLTHVAGIPNLHPVDGPADLLDWDRVVGSIAALRPLYPRGTPAYLAMTFGWILGEVVRRTDPPHRDFGAFVRDEVCLPLGADSLWLGLPPELEPRVARLSGQADFAARISERHGSGAMPLGAALAPDVFNRADVHQACWPAVGGIANARSVARLFAAVADTAGTHAGGVLRPATIAALATPREPADGDRVLAQAPPVGTGGFWVGGNPLIGLGAGIVFVPGAGGTIAWADRDLDLSVAILHDRMSLRPGDPHPFADIVAAVRELAMGAA